MTAIIRCSGFFLERKRAINECENKKEGQEERIKAVKVPLPLQESQLR